MDGTKGATKHHINSRQIKAARALLDWSQEDLAKAASLSIATIRKLELGHISPRGKTQQLLHYAFEDAGLEFIEPNGVRQRPEDITVYQGEEGIRNFFDEVYHTCMRTGSEVIQVAPSAKLFFKLIGSYREAHAARMIAAQDRIKVKAIITEDCDTPVSVYCEGRYLSRHFVDSVPFYVYSDKYVIVSLKDDGDQKIIVIQSRDAAASFRRQFHSMWERATPLGNHNSPSRKTK